MYFELIQQRYNFIFKIIEQNFNFHLFSIQNAHNHPPTPGIEALVDIYHEAKKVGKKDLFEAAGKIVDAIMDERCKTVPGSYLPKPKNLSKTISRSRAKDRLKEPNEADIFFPVAKKFFQPNFYKGGICVPGARHLVFANETQLHHLAHC